MITIKEYAKQHKISMRAARWQLEEKMSQGILDRKKGPCNMFLYYKIEVPNLRWHDPFNRCKRA